MKSNHLLPLIACGLSLAALPAFAGDDHDASSKVKMLDTDGDGRVSRSEFVAGKQEKIQRLDANNDGVLTPAESSTAAKPEKKHWWSRGDKPADKAAGINAADTNGDGQVTSTEATAYADKSFARLDANNDGFLTESELKAAHK